MMAQLHERQCGTQLLDLLRQRFYVSGEETPFLLLTLVVLYPFTVCWIISSLLIGMRAAPDGTTGF